MTYTGAQCKSCGELFAISELSTGPKLIEWPSPSWKGNGACPKCGADHEYTRKDLVEIPEGDIAKDPLR